MKKRSVNITALSLFFIIVFSTSLFSFDVGSPNRPNPVPQPAPSNKVAVSLVQEKIKNWQNCLFSGFLFKQWISLGDPYLLTADRKPRDVIYEVNPQAVGSGNDALFMRCFMLLGYCTGSDYVYIKKHPQNMNNDEIRGLWHETIHAILAPHEGVIRGVELLYTSDPVCNGQSGESYTWYMENMFLNVLDKLERFEDEYKKGKVCRDDFLNNNWKVFLKYLTDLRNNGGCGKMGDAQLQQFKSLVGFEVDEKIIESNYKKIYRTTKDGKFMCPYSFKIIKIDAKDRYDGKEPITLTAVVAPEYNYREMKPKVYFAWDNLDDKIDGKTKKEKHIAVTETNSLELTNVMTMQPGTYKFRVRAYQEFVGPKTIVLDEANHTLVVTNEVSIQAPQVAAVGDAVSFAAVTDVNAAVMPTLQYAWRLKGSAQVIEDKQSFTKRVDHPGIYEFSVVVYQNDMIKKQSVKLGEAKHTMVVSQGTVVDITGPAQMSIGENVTYTAKVSRPDTETSGFAKAAGGIISSIGKELFGKDIMGSGTQAATQPYIFEWHVDGVRTGSTGGGLTHAFTAKGNHTVKVVAYEDAGGQRKKIGETTALVAVLEKKETQQVAGKGMTLEIMMRRPECDNRSPVCTFEEEIVPSYPIRANYSVKFVPVVRYNGKPVRAFSHSDLYDCYIWSSEGKKVNNVGPYASYGWDRTGTHSIEVELKQGWCQQYMKGGNTKAKLTVQVGGQGVSLNPFEKLMQKTSPATKQGPRKPSNKDVGSPSD